MFILIFYPAGALSELEEVDSGLMLNTHRTIAHVEAL